MRTKKKIMSARHASSGGLPELSPLLPDTFRLIVQWLGARPCGIGQPPDPQFRWGGTLRLPHPPPHAHPSSPALGAQGGTCAGLRCPRRGSRARSDQA